MKHCYIVTAFLAKKDSQDSKSEFLQFVAVSEKDSETVKRAVISNAEKSGYSCTGDIYVVMLSFDEVEATYTSLRSDNSVEREEGNVIYANFKPKTDRNT